MARKPNGHRFTPAEIDALVVEYEAGRGLVALSTPYGVDCAAVAYHLHKRGVQMRPVGVRTPKNQQVVRERVAKRKAQEQAEAQARASQVCVMCGVTFANSRRVKFCSRACGKRSSHLARMADPVRAAHMAAVARVYRASGRRPSRARRA